MMWSKHKSRVVEQEEQCNTIREKIAQKRDKKTVLEGTTMLLAIWVWMMTMMATEERENEIRFGSGLTYVPLQKKRRKLGL